VEELRVSSGSNTKSVAGAIASVLNDADKVALTCVGAGAVNQAVKAVAIARGFVAPSGFNLVVVPGFIDLEIDGEERTGMNLKVVKEK
jgi:stage V sporulation protein S